MIRKALVLFKVSSLLAEVVKPMGRNGRTPIGTAAKACRWERGQNEFWT